MLFCLTEGSVVGLKNECCVWPTEGSVVGLKNECCVWPHRGFTGWTKE